MTQRPFPPAQLHGVIREVLPGVHLVRGSMKVGPLRFSRNMTALVDGRRVILVNTVRLNDAGLQALDALGEVTDVIRLAGFHGSDDPFYKDRYGATVHAVEGQAYFEGIDPKGKRYFDPDNLLTATGELPLEGSLFVFGTDPPEALLRIPAGGGTLISGDSLQNWATTDEYFNVAAKVVMRLMGFVKPHQLGRGWVKDLKPDRTEIAAVLDLDFENDIPSHGDAVLGNAAELYRPAIEKYAIS